jgi:hypothetical protein
MRKWMMVTASICLVTAWCGCIDMQVKRQTLKKFIPVDPANVTVYSSLDEVQGDYQTIAIIHVEDKLVHDNPERMREHIRKKAGALGANAVIVGSLNAPEVPAEFHQTAFESDSANNNDRLDLPLPVIDETPDRQDAWLDATAIYIKNK